jgi:hypothetical protein
MALLSVSPTDLDFSLAGTSSEWHASCLVCVYASIVVINFDLSDGLLLAALIADIFGGHSDSNILTSALTKVCRTEYYDVFESPSTGFVKLLCRR